MTLVHVWRPQGLFGRVKFKKKSENKERGYCAREVCSKMLSGLFLMKSLSISITVLLGNKKAHTDTHAQYVHAPICIFEQLVYNVPEQACLAGKGKRTE